MSTATTPAHSRSKTYYLRLVISNLVVFGVLLVVVEGLASYALFARRLLSGGLAEELHTEYDPELGWVNRPSTYIRNMYGPGISLTINSQRVRSERDFDKAVPSGKWRAVCSGDSFTLGYGVDDHHTWCHLLSILEPRLETVNMGQGGYGVDQAYLWYMRDGARLEHQVHIVAVITDDFRRMQVDSFLGYPKPTLEVENGRLVVRNVPVPQRTRYQVWLSSVARRAKEELRSVDLTSRALTSVRPSASAPVPARSGEVNEETRRVVEQMLGHLARLHRAQGRRLMVVYLPDPSALTGDGANEWLRFMERTTRALAIPFVNVVESFRRLSPEEAAGMFIREGAIAYAGATGHLTNSGNQRVAEIVYAALVAGNPDLFHD